MDPRPLPAQRKICCAPLCFSLIPHDIDIVSHAGFVAVLIGAPGVFMQESLWVGSQRLVAGKVVTPVFNMARVQKWVKKGQVISEIIYIPHG